MYHVITSGHQQQHSSGCKVKAAQSSLAVAPGASTSSSRPTAALAFLRLSSANCELSGPPRRRNAQTGTSQHPRGAFPALFLFATLSRARTFTVLLRPRSKTLRFFLWTEILYFSGWVLGTYFWAFSPGFSNYVDFCHSVPLLFLFRFRMTCRPVWNLIQEARYYYAVVVEIVIRLSRWL